MMNKKFFILGLMASFAMAGCSDDSSDNDKAPTCNNGVLEAGEMCDGTAFDLSNEAVKAISDRCKAKQGTLRCDASACTNVSAVSCDADCKNGDKKCDGTTLQVCKDFAWTAEENCADSQKICKDNACTDADCKNGDKKCDGTTLQVCKDFAWTAEENCADSQKICKDNACTAEQTSTVCTENEKDCSGNIARVCEGGVWKEENCADSGKFCYNNACVECREDEEKCENDTHTFCKGGVKQTEKCSDTGMICGEKSCVFGPPECEEDAEVCEGNTFKVCVSQHWLKENCTENGKVCSATRGCITDTTYTSTCEGNVLKMCNGSDCIEEDCTPLGAKCDAAKSDCAKAAFTCDGTKVKIDGTDYSFDCASNASNTALSDNEREKAVCNPSLGCSDAACDGDTLKVCSMEGSSVDCSSLSEDCDAGMCSNELAMCTACKEGSATCTGSVAKVCKDGKYVEENCADSFRTCKDGTGCYNTDPCPKDGDARCTADGVYEICDGATKIWMKEDCKAANMECSVEKDGCYGAALATCGNDIKEEGEACDGTAVYKTCADFDSNYQWEGTPGCNPTCTKVTTGTCKHKQMIIIGEWQLSSLDSILTMIKAGNAVIKGGFVTSVADGAGGWTLGAWGNASNPSFDSRYVSFFADESSSNGSLYDSSEFTFEVKRNSAGPRKLKVAFYDGSTQIAGSVSSEIAISTSSESHTVRVPKLNANGRLAVRISAYASQTASSGTMTISNPVLKVTKKAVD